MKALEDGMIISAKMIQKPRKHRQCDDCGFGLFPGQPALRLYGAAFSTDPPRELYFHPSCARHSLEKTSEPKIEAALRI